MWAPTNPARPVMRYVSSGIVLIQSGCTGLGTPHIKLKRADSEDDKVRERPDAVAVGAAVPLRGKACGPPKRHRLLI